MLSTRLMKMTEKEETINIKVKILVVILFTIITITVLHVLINESMAQEKGIIPVAPKNVTNQTLHDLTPEHTDVLTDLLFVYDMLRAYLLIICNPEVRYEIANIIEKLDNVVNVDIINGPYDLIVEIIFDTMDDLKEKVQHDINNIDRLMSTLTLIRSDDV